MVTSTLASAVPEFIRYSQTSGPPEPTNHMSELGCEQVPSPMPDESACSASKPSAIWPVADTAVPPPPFPPGGVPMVAEPGPETVTGAVEAVFVFGPFLLVEVVLPGVGVVPAVGVVFGADLPLAALPLGGLAVAGAVGAAGTELTVTEPAAVVPAEAVPAEAAPVALAVPADEGAADCEGTAIIEMSGAPPPGAPGGPPLVPDVP